jgi:hypothetical protein
VTTEEARHRLEVLHADTAPGGSRDIAHLRPSPRTLDQFKADREALRTVLDELHRLNIAVSEQRKTLQNIANTKKSIARKLARERSPHAAARRTGRKP